MNPQLREASMYLDRPIGIDLGTTNSAVALLAPDGRDLLLYTDRFRRKVVPSVVAWDPSGEGSFVVGFGAWNRRGMTPEPVTSIKRKMGQATRVGVGPHELTPESVSAKILSELVSGMGVYAGARLESYTLSLSRAVITVPAYFDAPQIEATRRAGEEAGLVVLGLLQEPTAAAMYHAWKHGLSDGTFMVYDLGGGTFDVSVIRCMMGEYQVLGIHGDNYLGGDDFDRRFAEFLRQHLVQQGYKLDLDVQNSADDATRFLILTRIAQEVKEALSASEFQYVGRRDIFKDHDGQPVTLDLEVSRGEWEGLMRSYVEQTIVCCHEALKLATQAAGVGLSDIDHVLLVGGSTRVPLVQERVAAEFCGAGRSKAAVPLQDEPDTCVALGAAIHAANLGGLTLGDASQELSLNISSALATRRASTRVTGRLSGAGAERVVEVTLVRGDGETVARSETEDGRFKLSEVELPDEGMYPFELVLLAGGGEPVVSLPMALYRGGDARSTGSALSNPSVLAKDIYLEVVKLGRPDRKLLVEKGSSLPVEARFRFVTADQSGAVILRLLQNRMPIRTIHIEVPTSLALGTPVDLLLRIDETMQMVAEGGVADQVFWAQIEPPPSRQERTWGEVEETLDEAEQVAERLWGHDATWFRERLGYLKAGIQEAARTDPDKLQVLVGRLEDLLADYRSEDHSLSPSYDRFERILNLIRRRVFQKDEEERTLGLTASQWTERLAEIERRGADAYAGRDQGTWSRTYSQAQAIYESLSQDESRFGKTDESDQLARSVQSARFLVEQFKEALAILVLSENAETRKLQQQEKLAVLDALNDEVIRPLDALGDRPPVEARGSVEKIHAALRRIERRLERLPAMGLVSER